MAHRKVCYLPEVRARLTPSGALRYHILYSMLAPSLHLLTKLKKVKCWYYSLAWMCLRRPWDLDLGGP